MKRIWQISIVFLTPIVMANGCRHEHPTPTAGKGGNAVLRVTPQHHGDNIDSCMVYIKYNAQDTPSSYDDSTRCVMVGNKPVAVFDGLRAGNYYLFGKGYDEDIFMEVMGGIPHTISVESDVDVILPVTEGD